MHRRARFALYATLGLAAVATLIPEHQARSIQATAPPSADAPLSGKVSPGLATRAVSADSLQASIRRAVAGDSPPDYERAHWKRLQRLYDSRNFDPIWLDVKSTTGSLKPRAVQLVEALANANTHALSADTSLQKALLASMVELERNRSSAVLGARADVLLTAAFVQYATNLLTGQIDPRSVNPSWHIDPHDVDIDSALVETLGNDDLATSLASLPPSHPDYAKLAAELGHYRAIVSNGGWPVVPELGVLHPGDTASARELGTLLGRLHMEGYLPLVALTPAGSVTSSADSAPAAGPASRAIYDTTLANAIALFQLRHGLVVDSIIGPATRTALNRTATFRLQQIAANMERHRWMSRERVHRYVAVNVPSFRLRAFDNGREMLAMNVVVGAEYGGRSTPVFADSMAYVVFRPYWNVPTSIANAELWPKQRQDPSYFRRNGYEVVNASWGRYIRQKPAPNNALGQVKFIFPNDYAIYLHDTPAQALFDENVRAFSHGCIRVEHPDRLAEFVLSGQGWTLDRVREAMTSGSDDRRVDLTEKLPVYIVYFTTFFRDGALHFGNDIYDRDARLVGAMRSAALPNDSAASHSQALVELTRRFVSR